MNEVVRVAPADTLRLRQEVLRRGERVTFAGDDHPEAVHLALLDDSGDVVACGHVRPEQAPDGLVASGAALGGRPWRLGGMAAAPELRGSGQGSRVLRALLDAAREQGASSLWCNARTPARSFYLREGLQAWGDEWVAGANGPHVVMWRALC